MEDSLHPCILEVPFTQRNAVGRHVEIFSISHIPLPLSTRDRAFLWPWVPHQFPVIPHQPSVFKIPFLQEHPDANAQGFIAVFQSLSFHVPILLLPLYSSILFKCPTFKGIELYILCQLQMYNDVHNQAF